MCLTRTGIRSRSSIKASDRTTLAKAVKGDNSGCLPFKVALCAVMYAKQRNQEQYRDAMCPFGEGA